MEEPDKLVDRYVNEGRKNSGNRDYYELVKLSLIGAGVVALIFAYLVYNGYFKAECPEMNCPEVTCEQAEIPGCPICPDMDCPDNYNTCNFPDELNINLNGS